MKKTLLHKIDHPWVKYMIRSHGKGFYNFWSKAFDPKENGGYLYVIQLGNTDIFKIGISIDVNARLKQLQRRSPIDLRVVHEWWSHDYKLCEKVLHNRFASKRIKGEWFQLEPTDITSIFRSFQEQEMDLKWNKN